MRIAAACAASMLVFAGGASASDDVWTPAVAANGAFSVDTPCSTAEVVEFRKLPEPLMPGVTFVPNTRVACKHGETLLVAGVYDVAGYPATGPAVFDSFVQQLRSDKTAEGVASVTTINDRRALLNRQEKDGVLAQTGFVEISRSKLVVMIGGVYGGGMKIEDQRALVDRFYGSVKVTAK